MGLVSTWLNGIGLGYAFPAFRAAGIVTPSALAELDLAHYEALGIVSPDDRRKLFYLVQRIRLATDTQSNEQQAIDDVVNQSLAGSILSDGDGDGDGDGDDDDDDDDDEIAEEREAQNIVVEESCISSRKGMSQAYEHSKYPPQMMTTKNASKENRIRASNDQIKSTVTTRSRNRIEAVAPLFAKINQPEIIPQNFIGIGSNKSDESDWAEESDVFVADDEASQSSRRTSRRLQEKKMKEVEAKLIPSMDDQEENADSSTQGDRKSRRGVGSNTKLGYTGDAEMPTKRRVHASRIIRSSTSDLDADDEGSVTAGTRKSGVQAPRTRRFESSKLQNPTCRLGKQLSTIPSDSIAPMSPLIKLSLASLDSDLTQPKRVDRKTLSTVNKKLGISSSVNEDLIGEKPPGIQGKLKKRSSSLSGSDTDSFPQHPHVFPIQKAEAESDSEVPNLRRRSLTGVGVISSSSDTEGQSGRRRSRSSIGENHSLKPLIAKPLRKPALDVDSPKCQDDPVAMFVHGTVEDNSWNAQITRLRQDTQVNHEQLHGVQSREDFCDEDMRIRVVVRKRPMSNSESNSSKEVDVIHPLEYDGYGRILVYQPKTRVDLTRHIETIPFAFDNVFDEGSCNKDIYERSIRNLIPGVFEEGQWASVFAYGQTGSGKTFTMMGCNITGIRAGTSQDDINNYGLYYMAARDVFQIANMKDYKHMKLGVSLFEIYGGKLFDLLNKRNPVKCLEDHKGKVCFPGLSEYPVSDADQLMRLIENGTCNRSTGTTSKNADSSRSHAILQISVRKTVGRQKNVEHGRLTFIDLAGSERGADTSNASRSTRLEGAEINTSLLALKEVIRALATGDSLTHIPFRGSKLTQVLKESFVGENARSVMIACIAPNMSNCEHTLNTLRYADRVKERNPKTGALAASRIASTRVRSSKLSARLSSSFGVDAPEIDKEENLFKECLQDHYDEDDAELFESTSYHEQYVEENEDSSHHETYVDDNEENSYHEKDIEVNDENSYYGSISEFSVNNEKRDMTKVDSSFNVSTNKFSRSERIQTDKSTEAATLIACHRKVMSEMLGMCKAEMAIANKVDQDRDVIDSYLDELEGLHEKQCEMLSSLHEKLIVYRRARSTLKQASVDMVSEDDSFEDLRD
jgi:kinesin family member 2/24